ncbi:hypothetical protein [Puniceibacterium sp. IMCC21224]|uniref:hypothetical protein n=1 Tax=Puniceibacterium sp. IMCC21224 TaxID=1618204 RepID=UPI00064D9749|nr:hypothetical protein [Puniceibacterium sp. IMCC21224]KMK65714.1 hypothetical protein IMCC21224_11548 [Puniceibacterium sp. IMCC21224]
MATSHRWIIMVSTFLALAGCSSGGSDRTPSALRTGSTADESACLGAVQTAARQTGTVISSDFTPANTLVIVGVGSPQDRWRCLASKGQASGVRPLDSGGAL